MKLTAENYAEQSKKIDFSKLDSKFKKAHEDTSRFLKFYNKDEQVKKGIDAYLKAINEELAKQKKPAAKKPKSKGKTSKKRVYKKPEADFLIIGNHYFIKEDFAEGAEYVLVENSPRTKLVENKATNRHTVKGHEYHGNGTVKEALELYDKIKKLPDEPSPQTELLNFALETLKIPISEYKDKIEINGSEKRLPEHFPLDFEQYRQRVREMVSAIPKLDKALSKTQILMWFKAQARINLKKQAARKSLNQVGMYLAEKDLAMVLSDTKVAMLPAAEAYAEFVNKLIEMDLNINNHDQFNHVGREISKGAFARIQHNMEDPKIGAAKVKRELKDMLNDTLEMVEERMGSLSAYEEHITPEEDKTLRADLARWTDEEFVDYETKLKMRDKKAALADEVDKTEEFLKETNLSYAAQETLEMLRTRRDNMLEPFMTSFTAEKGSHAAMTDTAINQLAEAGLVTITSPNKAGFSYVILNSHDADQDNWERGIISFMVAKLEVNYSDAQGMLEAQNFYATQAWGKGLDAKEAFEYIAEKAGWNKQSSTPAPKASGSLINSPLGKIVRVGTDRLIYVTDWNIETDSGEGIPLETSSAEAITNKPKLAKYYDKQSKQIERGSWQLTDIKPMPSWRSNLSGEFTLQHVLQLTGYKYKTVKPVKYKLVPADKGLAKIFNKFRGNDELRPVMSYMNFDEHGVTATDAHRLLHVGGKVLKKNRGLFKPDGSKPAKGEVSKYPNYPAVVPTDNPHEFKVNPLELYNYARLMNQSRLLNPSSKYVVVAFENERGEESLGLNCIFLENIAEAMLMLGGSDWWVQVGEPHRAVMFVNKQGTVSPEDDTYALQMPVMLQDGKVYGFTYPDGQRSGGFHFSLLENSVCLEDGTPVELQEMISKVQNDSGQTEAPKPAPEKSIEEQLKQANFTQKFYHDMVDGFRIAKGKRGEDDNYAEFEANNGRYRLQYNDLINAKGSFKDELYMIEGIDLYNLLTSPNTWQRKPDEFGAFWKSNMTEKEVLDVLTGKVVDPEAFEVILDGVARHSENLAKSKGAEMYSADILKRYRDNEANNLHTENLMLLSFYYGEAEDHELAKALNENKMLGNEPTANMIEARAELEKKASKWYRELQKDAGETPDPMPPAKGGSVQNSGHLYVVYKDQKIEIDSLEKASKAWDKFRDQLLRKGYEVDEIGPGVMIENEKGEVVGRISWNGKVWKGAEYKSGDKPVFDPFNDGQITNLKTVGKYTIANLPDGKVTVGGVTGRETATLGKMGGRFIPNGKTPKGGNGRVYYFNAEQRPEVEKVLKEMNSTGKKSPETVADIMRELADWRKQNPDAEMPAEEVKAFARRVNDIRNAGAVTRDKNRTGKKVLEPTFDNLLRWSNSPGRYDMQGIDAPTSAKKTISARIGPLDKFLSNFGIKF